jgi:hypothetical protein
MGLALDFRRSTPDELSHRPVMVMYFGVVTWVGGAAGLALLESRRLGRFARPAMIVMAVLLLAVPAYFGSGVQRMWAMRNFSPVRVPIGLYRAAEYMRDHGGARTSSRIHSSIGPTPWLLCQSEGRTPRCSPESRFPPHPLDSR